MFPELAKTKGLLRGGNTIWFIIVHTPKRVEFGGSTGVLVSVVCTLVFEFATPVILFNNIFLQYIKQLF